MCHNCRFPDQQRVLKMWLSPLRGWCSLTMACTGKFVYMADHFILLRLNLIDLSADREGWWFEHSCVIVVGLFVSRGC